MITEKLQFWVYRLRTILNSVKVLYTLPPEKVEAFVESYKVYDFDWANEQEMIDKFGPNYYPEVMKRVVDYYVVINHLCALGQVEKMYIPPAIDLSKSIIQNQNLFEERMSRDLGLKKGDKVLDIGCGRGRIASHMANFSGAHVTGMNIDHGQLDSAKRYAKGNGLTEKVQFQQGDLNNRPLPFQDNSFDAVYEVQVFSLAKDLLSLFQDIHRVLKPGGKFACLEWVSLDAYDPKNPHHADLMRQIKPLIGAIGTPTVANYVDLLSRAGFDVTINENASLNGLQSALIDNADKFYTRLNKAVKFLVKYKILPKHFPVLFDRLSEGGQAFVEADRMKLLTTSHYIVAKKRG